MHALGVEEARKRLPELLRRAHQGESTLIKKRGTPYARIAPIDHPVESSGLFSLRGTGKGLWDTEITDTICDYRDEWA